MAHGLARCLRFLCEVASFMRTIAEGPGGCDLLKHKVQYWIGRSSVLAICPYYCDQVVNECTLHPIDCRSRCWPMSSTSRLHERAPRLRRLCSGWGAAYCK